MFVAHFRLELKRKSRKEVSRKIKLLERSYKKNRRRNENAGRKVECGRRNCWLSDIKNAGNSQVEKSSFFSISPPSFFCELAAASSYIPSLSIFFSFFSSLHVFFILMYFNSLCFPLIYIQTYNLIEESIFVCDSISPKKKQQAIVTIP